MRIVNVSVLLQEIVVETLRGLFPPIREVASVSFHNAVV